MKTQAVKVIYSNWLDRGLGKVSQGGFSGRKNSSEILSGTNPPPENELWCFHIHIRQLKYNGEGTMAHLLEIGVPSISFTPC